MHRPFQTLYRSLSWVSGIEEQFERSQGCSGEGDSGFGPVEAEAAKGGPRLPEWSGFAVPGLLEHSSIEEQIRAGTIREWTGYAFRSEYYKRTIERALTKAERAGGALVCYVGGNHAQLNPPHRAGGEAKYFSQQYPASRGRTASILVEKLSRYTATGLLDDFRPTAFEKAALARMGDNERPPRELAGPDFRFFGRFFLLTRGHDRRRSQFVTASVRFYLSRRSGWLLLLLGFMFLAAVDNAPGELVFTNFSAAKPLKIMAVEDSITDDCSINGAWRQ